MTLLKILFQLKIKLLLFLTFLLFFQCKKYDFNEYIKEKLESRHGKPTLFELNSISFSAKNFRREYYSERAHFEQEFDPPLPTELEQKLNNYIEESILLREAIANVDFNSSDARAYMWPYIRKAAIAYYLEKESGGYDLVENYESIEISDDLINDYYQKNKSRIKGENQETSLRKLKNTAKFLKWKKLYEDTNENKKILLGRMKRDNKVKLEPRELLNVE